MKFKSQEYELEKITSNDMINHLKGLNEVNSFFILEDNYCNYIQCINYKGSIIIEKRIYENNSFKHYILSHDLEDKSLALDDGNFKRYFSEIFSIEEVVLLFIEFYNYFSANDMELDIINNYSSIDDIKMRDITNEFPKLEKGFIFIKWLDSAVDNFKETLKEFIVAIEPFIIEELKKDCIGRKISNENMPFFCSSFEVIDIEWAVESIIEIIEKYGFTNDIILYKKLFLNDKKFLKINVDDFKR